MLLLILVRHHLLLTELVWVSTLTGLPLIALPKILSRVLLPSHLLVLVPIVIVFELLLRTCLLLRISVLIILILLRLEWLLLELLLLRPRAIIIVVVVAFEWVLLILLEAYSLVRSEIWYLRNLRFEIIWIKLSTTKPLLWVFVWWHKISSLSWWFCFQCTCKRNTIFGFLHTFND